MSVWIDGQPGHCVDVTDRGLLYGDGLFETVAVHDGAPAYWDRHMHRLEHGCHRLGIPAPDRRALDAEVRALCAERAEGVLKVIVTRGSGGRGYRPPAAPAPRRIVSVHPPPDYPARFWQEGVALRWCETRLSDNPALAGLKHLGRLEQVLARAEWDDPEVPEGLMCDSQGNVVEGTMTNVFIARDGGLVTPALRRCGVAGVMRAVVMDTATTMGVACEERAVTADELQRADEVFVCNSVIGLWPVREVGGRAIAMGSLSRHLVAAVGRDG